MERHGHRARGAWAHLLLLVPLLLGVAAMHTFGHPHEPGPAPQAAAAGAHSTGHGSAASVHGSDRGPAASVHESDRGPAASVHESGADHGSAASAHGTDARGSAEPPPMDPMTMCLAVVGLAVLLLGAAATVLRLPALRRRPPGTRLRTVLRTLPPPAPPSLARLQVMRV
ncbi:hypothetical protein CLV63_113158 [Murinocardiopsis flavida]|uniref:Uncharacterized protein n=1 Tax=Murinocardiopsis flavida TaxID=645275 RepID=A0A2P8DFK4_9ACTN|nr:hypothetical protein CLV63_113158 [Murinocardiopsis flavida]